MKKFEVDDLISIRNFCSYAAYGCFIHEEIPEIGLLESLLFSNLSGAKSQTLSK